MSTYLNVGTKVCLSQRGHNGFFYPDLESWETTAVRTRVIKQSWIGSNLTAVLISESSIYGTGRNDRLIPVWVESDQIIKE